jgi:XTP/dITP diphosphohydrolase
MPCSVGAVGQERVKRLRLLVATNNAGKLREFRQLLRDLPVHPVSPAEIGLILEVDETGSTFADNARLKAAAFATASGLPTLADDSGLEVDALGGEPGVFSARYGGSGLTEEARYRLVLDRLAGVPWESRGARFRCVIALAADPRAGSSLPPLSFAAGRCEGFVARTPRGEHGFGYDPIFYMPEYGLTMAELTAEQKNRSSHRARAMQAARTILAPGLRTELPAVLSEVQFRPLQPGDCASLARCCGLAVADLERALVDAESGAPPALVAVFAGEAVAFGEISLLKGDSTAIKCLIVSPATIPGVDQALRRVLREMARDRGAVPS